MTVEDAAAIAQHDVVVFADAAVSGPEPFYFERLEPQMAVSFSSHSVAPAAALALSEELFGKRVPGYVLGIRGYEFNEFGAAAVGAGADESGCSGGFYWHGSDNGRV